MVPKYCTNYLQILLLSLASAAFALLSAEIALRILGYSVWKRTDKFDHVPLVTEPDAALGWRNKPDRYSYSVTGDGVNVIELSIAQDGSRISSSESPDDDKNSVWVFGGSFTQGWGITDGKEFTARLDKKVADTAFRNFGVPGFGTLQSYYLFKERLRHGHRTPDAVFYGFVDLHLDRNVCTKHWIYTLGRAAKHQAWVKVPYARLSRETGFKTYPPTAYSLWPLSQDSVLINFLQERWIAMSDIPVKANMNEVTLRILRDWKDEVARMKSRFLVVILYAPKAISWLPAQLDRLGIDYIDVSNTPYPQHGTTVPFDGHPNGSIHELWATQIALKSSAYSR